MKGDDLMLALTIFALMLVPVVIVLAHVVRRIEQERKQREQLRRHVREGE